MKETNVCERLVNGNLARIVSQKLTPTEPSIDELKATLALALEGAVGVNADLLTPGVVEATLVYIRARPSVTVQELQEEREREREA